MPWPEDTDPGQVVDNITEEFCVGEQLGFDSGWVAEQPLFALRHRFGVADAAGQHRGAHHDAQAGDGGDNTAAAPSGQGWREDTATLDLLSGGRLDAGFGRGQGGYEYAGYNVKHDESQARFQESVRIIEGLWTTRNFTYEGEYFQVEETNLVPPPVQKPHPPMYIAATRSRETQDFAAASGHSGIMGVGAGHHRRPRPVQPVGKGLAKWLARKMDLGGIPFFRYFYVAETEEQARRDSEAALNWTMDVNQWRRTYQRGSEVYDSLDTFRQSRTEYPPSFEYLYQHRAFIGNPDQIIAKISALQDAGIGYFGCNFSFGGMPQDKVLKSMELFAEKVMPEFA